MSLHRFDPFELDESRRELRLRGEVVSLQPRVFDLLAYLVRHHCRVVTKDELLDALWGDVHVTEGSLQRAISLARSALRAGGLEDAIRTFSRKGYRFCAGLDGAGVEPRTDDAFARRDWSGAVAAFEGACDLGPPDLERWGQALDRSGRLAEAVDPLERAVQGYAAEGRRLDAARVLVRLSRIAYDRGEMAVASGCVRRAARHLETEQESHEHGLVAWMESRLAAVRGDLDRNVALAEETVALGQRLGFPGLEALGLMTGGLGLLARGELERGIAWHDEAAAAALAGELSAECAGVVYCGVIWSCCNRGDWRRASEWTDQFTRLCERSGISSFPGLCQLHRAEVLHVRGEIESAEREVRSACELLRQVTPFAEGDAQRLLGEIRMAKADLEGAEAAFKRAHELGWSPQPGYALLLLSRGEPQSALRGLERALSEPDWSSQQRRVVLLAHLVIVATTAGESETAERAMGELEAHSLELAPALEAFVARARAELAAHGGQWEASVRHLRRAQQLWREQRSPLLGAAARLRLAELLIARGDAEAADLELAAARPLFERCGAELLLQRCDALNV